MIEVGSPRVLIGALVVYVVQCGGTLDGFRSFLRAQLQAHDSNNASIDVPPHMWGMPKVAALAAVASGGVLSRFADLSDVPFPRFVAMFREMVEDDVLWKSLGVVVDQAPAIVSDVIARAGSGGEGLN